MAYRVGRVEDAVAALAEHFTIRAHHYGAYGQRSLAIRFLRLGKSDLQVVPICVQCLPPIDWISQAHYQRRAHV